MSAASVLLLGMLVGLPAMLLALVLGYTAINGARSRRAEQSAQSPASGLMRELQHSVVDINRQLAGQHEALSRLLSERRRAAAERTAAAAASAAEAPAAATTAPTHTAATRATATRASAATAAPTPAARARTQRSTATAAISGAAQAAAPQGVLHSVASAMDTPNGELSAPGGIRQQISTLIAEGLSDRAIARRLHIGLEEVRLSALAAQPAERAS